MYSTPTLATRFARNTRVMRGDQPLSEDQMRAAAPSIFAEDKHASRSERYTYIPTIDVLHGLRKEGFEPFMVAQGAGRVEGKAEFTKHMIRMRHAGQANQHVHISVRAESKHRKRLNPGKTDLHRWRETFAAKLRERGVEAESTRQSMRMNGRIYDPLWRIKAREDGRLRKGGCQHEVRGAGPGHSRESNANVDADRYGFG